ncbi:MAG: hypothetical protein ABSE80_13570 [Halobacteriota archaeon]|jgi:hypothetical protein
MTKKELQKQIDELRVRIEALEAMLTWMPYMVTNSMGAPLPFPGSTTTCNNESTQEERYGNK